MLKFQLKKLKHLSTMSATWPYFCFMTKHVMKSTFLLMPFIGHFKAFHVFPNYFHMSWDEATYFFVL